MALGVDILVDCTSSVREATSGSVPCASSVLAYIVPNVHQISIQFLPISCKISYYRPNATSVFVVDKAYFVNIIMYNVVLLPSYIAHGIPAILQTLYLHLKSKIIESDFPPQTTFWLLLADPK